MPAKKQTEDQGAEQTAPLRAPAQRYRVIAHGISTVTGPWYKGATLEAAQVGSEERIAHLLERGAIEVTTDD